MTPRTGPIPWTDADHRWQQHFNDYCMDNFGGREPSGREHDEASAYADQQTEEEDV